MCPLSSRRSSITRLSVDDKAQLSKEVSNQERPAKAAPDTIPESKSGKKKQESDSDVGKSPS